MDADIPQNASALTYIHRFVLEAGKDGISFTSQNIPFQVSWTSLDLPRQEKSAPAFEGKADKVFVLIFPTRASPWKNGSRSGRTDDRSSWKS
jgi:hypothetical protein